MEGNFAIVNLDGVIVDNRVVRHLNLICFAVIITFFVIVVIVDFSTVAITTIPVFIVAIEAEGTVPLPLFDIGE